MLDLTVGKEWKAIIHFTLPMFIGSVFQQLYNVVDSMIVGRFVGKEALAAVGGSFPIIMLISALMIGVTMGTSILVAQYYGAKDIENVKITIHSAYVILIIGALALGCIGILCSELILTIMKVPNDIFKDSKDYLDIMYLGMFGAFGYNTVSGILRGIGDSKTPVYFLVLATVLNVILDIIFVLQFHMGVKGVAWATLIAQFVSFVTAFIYLYYKNKIFQFNFFKMSFNKRNILLSLKLGIPTGIQQICLSLGIMTMQTLINGYGENAMAAFASVSKIDAFAALPMNNFSLAISTFVAQNIGAGEEKRAKRGLYVTNVMVSITSLTMTVLVWGLGEKLIGIFSKDILVIKYGMEYLKIVGAGYVIIGVMFTFVGFIRGTGHTLFPTFVTLTSLWLIRIPIAIIGSKYFGVKGLWIGIPIGWFFGLTIAVIYYLVGKWKIKVVPDIEIRR